MLSKVDPTQTDSWRLLRKHFHELEYRSIQELFDEHPDRVRCMSLHRPHLVADLSKHRMTEETFELFDALGEECQVHKGIQSMFSGLAINETENRPVLHVALRMPKGSVLKLGDHNIVEDVHHVLGRMERFSEKVINGSHKGYTGRAITDVVNIGIGGSDLGPYMATEALKYYRNHLRMHFVSNVDATHLVETLKHCHPATTLFIVASKTFTTQETMTNALSARDWLLDGAGDASAISSHFVALSTNAKAVEDFGISPDHRFEFWDWVGGRYSMWSAIGLPIMLSLGATHFKAMLDGAHEIDEEVKKLGTRSVSGRLAQASIWYNNFFGAETHAILPYEQYLHRFPAYLQQGDMESNGKSMDRNGKRLSYQSGTIIWGEPGTNGQHAFYQLLHQGTKVVPCDFIAFAKSLHTLGDHHDKLLANCFAQSMALMKGKSQSEAQVELESAGLSAKDVMKMLPFKVFEGNVPSTTLLFDVLTPSTLGQLIAIYEHKIFIEGLYLNIFSFDQWGVELGKQLAKPILERLQHKNSHASLDQSTLSLLNETINFRKVNS
jgi:glucose-6-phosphate isomerase